jgi:diadenosine tetraphosphate (Ap4A) HIT family hydrolase/5-methylcytosine-specific restriction endonuclease McrA
MPGMSDAFDALRTFIQQRMRMSHIYQPVMLQVLLENSGRATTRQIAAAFLSRDESQLEYYEQVVGKMPGRVLQSHGVVDRHGGEYRLAPTLGDLSDDERQSLIQLCAAAIEQFKTKHGAAIWEHRRPGLGIIPGKARYETLKRAAFRCELCGVSAEERALDVDHILPRAVGGLDDADNLQALCWQCNTNKGAGDDADLRGICNSYGEREAGCLFCNPDRHIVAENPLAILIEDAFPVTPGHLLAIPRRHVADYFDLRQPERNALQRLLDTGRTQSIADDPTVSGFNIGVNAGAAAGQTILHCHVHLIPRRWGDVANPRGGVRGVLPGRQDYEARHGDL